MTDETALETAHAGHDTGHDTLPRGAVLLIEDDSTIAEEIVAELSGHGFDVQHRATGDAGLAAALAGGVDVMVVDRLLPGMDGLTVIETMRQRGIRTPVLVLSALSAVDDRVTGLKAGGDDYLSKPFAMEELLARVEALMRRPDDTRNTRLRVGPLEMDLIERRVWRDGREIELLPREFRLLEYLMRRPDQVLTRSMLLEDVWQYRFIPRTNLVDVHIGKLRRKVDAPGEEPLIRSIRGTGFLLRVPD
ncbi:response regulator transcription factor [Acetobacter indonesiensis]|jgi:two-component system OmpR family response regulator|uniref:Two component transcriptional regulator KdpE n=1 Tax=Acetobacter indonesiensis TaxID=104101 RepID=A0A6N3T111_9PROT|nr:response regulator transcription factor [Acetobacter indonesiensis]MCI1545093.1 response regulator transcription factor [Acetobacter indonesiensis]MCI1764663.1 response regulator transcription factor [Acetobacter indonesiensis]MCP1230583.1 response regulator transcription factor [Acetobacter indonesiensis]GAN62884.1 two component transcriptional regulator KdpE [Acetobacter indonesiensis]GBQ56689.1 two component response regulator [Acetobacter indonesiensis NRIC 0313]